MAKRKNRTTWTAAMWREKRRAEGVERRDDQQTFIPEHIYRAGREITAMLMLPVLDWDSSLFKDDPLAVNGTNLQRPKAAAPNLCHYKDCMTLHSNRVSATKTVEGVHHVRWFCCGTCQRRWVSSGSPL